MNRGRGGNRGGGRGGNRGGGRASGGGQHYVYKGRSPRSADHYVVRRVPDGAATDWGDASSRSESSRGGRRTSDITSVDGVTKKFDGLSSSDYAHGPNPEPCGSGNLSPNDRNSKPVQSIPEAEPNPSNVPSFSPSYGGANNLPSLSTPSEHNAGTPKIIQSQDHAGDNNLPSLSTPSEHIAGTPKIIQSQDHDAENFGPSYLSGMPPVDGMHKKKDPFLSTGGQYCQEVQTGKIELEGNSRGGNRGGRGNRGGGRASGGRWHYVSKGRLPRSADHYIDGAAADWGDASSRSESSRGGRRTSDITSVDGVTKKFDGLSSSDYAHGPSPEPCGSGNLSPNDRNSKPVQNIPEAKLNPSNVPSFSPSYGGANNLLSLSTPSEHNAGTPKIIQSQDHGGDNNLPSLSTPSKHIAGTPKIIQSQDHDAENFGPSYLSCMPPVDGMHKKKDPFLSTGGQYCQEVQTGKIELEGNSRGGNRGGRGNRGGGRASGGRWHYVSKGRSARSADHYIVRRVPDGAAADWGDASSRSESSRGRRRTSDITSVDGVTKKFDGLSSSDYAHGPNPEPCGSGNLSPNDRNSKPVQSIPEAKLNPSNVPSFSPSYGGDNNLSSLSSPSEHNVGTPKIIRSQDHDVENFGPSYLSCTPPVDGMHKQKDPFLSTGGQYCLDVQTGKTELEENSGKDEFENSESQHKGFPFDICEERNTSIPKLKSSLLVKNRATRNEKRRMQGDNVKIIRPGMILLKCYISLTDQVKLIKSCRDLGRGPGGFYQPGYRDGAKLHLKMMCLGKNWDPETSSYSDLRPSDQAKPPPIPPEFQQLVKDALHDCHCYLGADSKVRNARDFVLSMSPNICIINFYTKQGRLGLHQDKDESQESLDNGIPVVSISLGDSAEFLFGDQRDVDQAEKVVLESGDVLIFGGKSRHIFHGVSTIIADTAPKVLSEETGLRPGRLNLTFRQY